MKSDPSSLSEVCAWKAGILDRGALILKVKKKTRIRGRTEMDKKDLMRVMTRYLEDMDIWANIIPIAMSMADRTPGGLLELAYYILDQGIAQKQSKLVEKAVSIWGREDSAGVLEEKCRISA